ncbi:MFS transporter [Pseudomonas fluorescens ABAC62]|nr:MFS transporter [Pseudomonas fluorescens ABAC62]
MTLNKSLAGWGLLVVLGLNLRPILSSISPLLGEIRLATGLSFQSSALLTSLPVVCMGLVALVGVRVEAQLGERRGIALGLMMILLACLVRWLMGQASALLVTALLGGAGVALIQALVPAMIKREFHHRVPVAMGVYSASLMAGGGLAALLSPLVATHLQQWQAGLGVWLLPALGALFLWAWLPLGAAKNPQVVPAFKGLRNRRAWLLAVYFGLVNCGYMSLVAWLPAYYQQLGWGVLPSGLAQTLGYLGLLLAPLDFPHVWVALCGFGLGACFALSLLLTLDHHRDPRQAGQLAAFVQGVGFLINAISPWLTGWLREITGSFASAWVVLTVTAVAMLVVTRVFSPATYRVESEVVAPGHA